MSSSISDFLGGHESAGGWGGEVVEGVFVNLKVRGQYGQDRTIMDSRKNNKVDDVVNQP